MAIAAALRGSAAGRGRRVLGATLSLGMLSELLAQQAPGEGPAAPVLVMTRAGQVLAHSQPGNVGISLSLRRPAQVQRIDPYTVTYETASSGSKRLLTHVTEIRGTDGWVVVAIQPLAGLLAKTEALRHTIQATAEGAADVMAGQANARSARLEAAAAQEQRRVAEETARQVRSENQAVIRQAVAELVQQQRAGALRDISRVERDSQAASQAAAAAMTRTAQGIAAQSGVKIQTEAARRAHLGLESMHELATQTAAAAAERMVIQSTGVLLVALMGALLVALLTARSAVRPITALAAGARSIAQGDFSHRVPISSEDELGQLAASFNRMAASIEASRAELQAGNAILAQEKRRIQAIVDNSPDGLLILSEDGSIGYANPAARTLLPWQEAAGGNGAAPLQAVLPSSLLRALEECLAAIDAGRASVCDLALETPKQVLQVRSVMLEGGGSPRSGVGRLIHLHDVTREREIDELKSNFVMLVSHELRTPLTSILGFSSYMLMGKMGPLTEAQRGGLDSIARQANRLKAIAADFLDLSRIEAGQLEIRREPVDLERVARRVLEELEPQAQERGLWLRLAPVQVPATALGDESRIAQILTNLVHNGIKFTERGGVEVAIAPGPETVRVEVRDTGIGIPTEEQARVFDRFYQVEGVVTRRAGGTGLGLSIVKILVHAHGGEVGVNSRPSSVESPDDGTTFYFTLPAAKPSLLVTR
jgi:signal transduction histidine kinase